VSRTNSGFHLNKADGKFLGVCAGIADYIGVEAIWVRVALIVLTLLGWGTAIPIYFVIAFVASPKSPAAIDYDGMDDERYLDRMSRRRDRSRRMRTDLSEMDRRLAEMERSYGRNSHLSSEIDRLR
jgi:phage shock protein C